MTNRVAFQGVPGAYSEAAARRFFGADVETLPRPAFADVFAAVARGRAARAVIPVENSLAGPVAGVLELLVSQPVTIVGELYLRISHGLMAPKGVRLGDVREVWSHPQALAQCAASLAALPGVIATPQYDTAGSAEMVAASGRRDLAAIASAEAARLYGLKLLRRNLADDATNRTRFVVLCRRTSRRSPVEQGRLKASVVIDLSTRPQALHACLGVLAEHGLDLVRLEPRPVPGRPWRPRYHLDFVARGARAASALGPALDRLRSVTGTLQLLGVYPAAT